MRKKYVLAEFSDIQMSFTCAAAHVVSVWGVTPEVPDHADQVDSCIVPAPHELNGPIMMEVEGLYIAMMLVYGANELLLQSHGRGT